MAMKIAFVSCNQSDSDDDNGQAEGTEGENNPAESNRQLEGENSEEPERTKKKMTKIAFVSCNL